MKIMLKKTVTETEEDAEVLEIPGGLVDEAVDKDQMEHKESIEELSRPIN